MFTSKNRKILESIDEHMFFSDLLIQ
jgi:hypothetical protein